MAQVQVRDRVIWIKHIHGQPKLASRLEALPAGSTVRLRVNGISGLWEKMRDGSNGAATPGLRPVGDVQTFWTELFNKRRGELVDLTIESQDLPEAGGASSASESEREAAWNAFKALTKAGWRSDAPYGKRDELHDR